MNYIYFSSLSIKSTDNLTKKILKNITTKILDFNLNN